MFNHFCDNFVIIQYFYALSCVEFSSKHKQFYVLIFNIDAFAPAESWCTTVKQNVHTELKVS